VDPAVNERALAYQLLGWIHYYSSEARAQFLVSLLMLNSGERAGHLGATNSGLLGVGLACDVLGLRRLADRYTGRNMSLAERSADPIAIGYANFGFAYHLHGLGRWDEAQEHWARGADAFWTTRDLRRWGVSNYGVAFMKWRRGQVAEAQEIARRMLGVAEEGGDHALRGWGLFVLGRTQWTLGDDAGALVSLREAEAILRSIPDRQILVSALGDLGYCLLRRGDLVAATTTLEQVAQLITTYEVRGFHAHALYWLLEAYIERFERASGAECPIWEQKIRTAMVNVERQARHDVEAQPGLARLRGRFHWLHDQHEKARAEWESSIALAEKLRFIPELAWTNAEMGWWLTSREHLDRAADLFRQMGAPGELGRQNAMRMSARR
jgi:tetratricopeptide (TPR) repeat protein